MLVRALHGLLALALTLGLSACKKTETTTPEHHGHHGHHADGSAHDESKHGDFEGREVVVNYAAKPGDVTICPYSGKKFEVKADSPRIDWQDKSWVFCCDKCLGEVQADPEKYLGKVLEAESAAEPAPSE